MTFEIVNTGKNTAKENMAYDVELLENLSSAPKAILHLYDWKMPSATYGYFSKPFDYLNSEAVDKHNVNLAKRPTGGGVIFHEYDFAFSFLLSANHPMFSLNTLQSYSLVNTIVANAIKAFSDDSIAPKLLSEQVFAQKCDLCKFCMSSLTIYDVTVDGKKVAGAAQRRTKKGLLHQGSVALSIPPDDFLSEIFLQNTAFASAMKSNTFALLSNRNSLDIPGLKTHFSAILCQEFRKKFDF